MTLSSRMDDSLSYDRNRRSFFWGAILSAILSIPLIIVFFNTFRGISTQHATGLAAVAGGLAEAYVTLGVLLFRSGCPSQQLSSCSDLSLQDIEFAH